MSVTKFIPRKEKTLVMGILNVTPDSFSDGGLYVSTSKALKRVSEMIKEGADIIDIGGESTRPGSSSVSAEEEIQRVLPVIKQIRKKFSNTIILSVDTNKAKVALAAIEAGASMVNSLGGFTFDVNLAKVIAEKKVPVAVYHIKGEPRTMQKGQIRYKNLIQEINKFFKKQMDIGKKFGIKSTQYILDPGIGFGKSVEHNITIIKNFRAFTKWKLPLLVGVSRKSHLGKILQNKLGLPDIPKPEERVDAGLAETAVAVLQGAQIVRTHDVFQTKKFLAILDELK
jgi:dihydropteroate synthase